MGRWLTGVATSSIRLKAGGPEQERYYVSEETGGT